jgi:hypothetical protein
MSGQHREAPRTDLLRVPFARMRRDGSEAEEGLDTFQLNCWG